MHRSTTHLRAVRRAIVATALVALSVVVTSTSSAAAGPSVSVATSIVYGVDGPDTPLPVSITLGNESAAMIVSAGGLVSAASCSGPYATTIGFGELTITHETDPTVPASSVVACELDLALGTSGLSTVDLIVSERDAFNVELGTSTTAIALEGITITTVVGDVSLTGGTYVSAEPRSVGDELSRSVTFGLPAPRSIAVTAPTDTTLAGCPATTADAAVCDLSRVLSLADLSVGTAPMAPTLLVDGWPVATPAADVAVPSERRLTIDATAVAPVVRAGEVVTVDATIDNIGTIDVSGLALGGAGFTDEAATCGSDPIAAITLAPGDSVTCRIARRVSTADVGAISPMTVRATPPFGGDSDLVDDDPTATDDVDAATIDEPFTVIAADATGALTPSATVVFIDDAGTDDLTIDVAIRSAGALSDAVVEMPAEPFAGVTLSACDEIVSGSCRLVLGSLAADASAIRTVGLHVDRTGLDAAGLVDASITGRLTAAGGVVSDLDPALISTAGAVGVVSSNRPDVTGDDMTFEVTVSGMPALTTTVSLSPADDRVFAIDACHRADDSAVEPVEAGDGFSLGDIAPTDVVTCSLRRAVIDDDRTLGTSAVGLLLRLSARGAVEERALDALLTTRSVRIESLAADPVPDVGYGVGASAAEPNTAHVSFDVVVRNATSAVATPVFGGTDSYTCEPAGSTTFRCRGNHAVSADDLAAGTYRWSVDATVDGFASATAEVEVPMPYRSIDLAVTELSRPPTPAGYGPGDEIRLLLQIRNRGTLTVTLDGLELASQIVVLRHEPVALLERSTETVDPGCLTVTSLAGGETLDCSLVVVVPNAADGGALEFRVSAGGLTAVDTIVVSLLPAAIPTPDVTDELPPTGSGLTGSLVASALALLLGGTVLAAASRRRPALLVAERPGGRRRAVRASGSDRR